MSDEESFLPPDDDDSIPEVPAEDVDSDSDRPDRYHLRMSAVCTSCNSVMYLQYVDVSGSPMEPAAMDHHRLLMTSLHQCPGEDHYPIYPYECPLPWT